LTSERTQRTGAAIRRAGADWAILTGFENVCYAAGHVASIEDGFSPFAGGPSTAFVSKVGDVVGLVVPNRVGGGSGVATLRSSSPTSATRPRSRRTRRETTFER
jgi:hypothetical protein